MFRRGYVMSGCLCGPNESCEACDPNWNEPAPPKIQDQANEQIKVNTMAIETRLIVAEVLCENMPFTDKFFEGKDKEQMAEEIKIMLESEKMSIDWVANVYVSRIQKQPIYVDYDDGKWSFFTMKSGSKKQLMDELKRVAKAHAAGQLMIKRGLSDMRPLSRAQRRSQRLM